MARRRTKFNFERILKIFIFDLVFCVFLYVLYTRAYMPFVAAEVKDAASNIDLIQKRTAASAASPASVPSITNYPPSKSTSVLPMRYAPADVYAFNNGYVRPFGLRWNENAPPSCSLRDIFNKMQSEVLALPANMRYIQDYQNRAVWGSVNQAFDKKCITR